jgi:hypothetical protein
VGNGVTEYTHACTHTHYAPGLPAAGADGVRFVKLPGPNPTVIFTGRLDPNTRDGIIRVQHTVSSAEEADKGVTERERERGINPTTHTQHTHTHTHTHTHMQHLFAWIGLELFESEDVRTRSPEAC